MKRSYYGTLLLLVAGFVLTIKANSLAENNAWIVRVIGIFLLILGIVHVVLIRKASGTKKD